MTVSASIIVAFIHHKPDLMFIDRQLLILFIYRMSSQYSTGTYNRLLFYLYSDNRIAKITK